MIVVVSCLVLHPDNVDQSCLGLEQLFLEFELQLEILDGALAVFIFLNLILQQTNLLKMARGVQSLLVLFELFRTSCTFQIPVFLSQSFIGFHDLLVLQDRPSIHLLEVLRVLWSGRNQPFESFSDFDLLLVDGLQCSRFSIPDLLGSLVSILFFSRLRDQLVLIEFVGA